MEWVLYILLGIFGLIAAAFVFELAIRIWHQVILGKIRVDATQGAGEFCLVANQILDRTGKKSVDVGTWLTPAEYRSVDKEVQRRWKSGEFPVKD